MASYIGSEECVTSQRGGPGYYEVSDGMRTLGGKMLCQLPLQPGDTLHLQCKIRGRLVVQYVKTMENEVVCKRTSD